MGKITVVGIGPGSLLDMTLRAKKTIEEAEVVAGYTTYLKLIPDLIKGKKIIGTGMMQEIDRCRMAVEEAKKGSNVVVVSSGDAGVYGMAGLVLELLLSDSYPPADACPPDRGAMGGGELTALANQQTPAHLAPQQTAPPTAQQTDHVAPQQSAPHIAQQTAPQQPAPLIGGPRGVIEEVQWGGVVAGVSAVNAAASILGAPLMHDFAVISLSNLLTPWEKIEKRVELAAQGDFVIALYNPKSHKRVQNIEIVREILLKYRDPKTPVGIVTDATREHECKVISTLENFTQEEINMVSLVIIGNSETYVKDGYMITPRGYQKKEQL